ncbi:MAG: hypothetical protein HKO89_02420 [Saprospiraceae bacterium]|nr:hypothetical protein [Bacteroidia bacterium]NNK89438.1 hypothetical protein [Saprospiraceae bacterium]
MAEKTTVFFHHEEHREWMRKIDFYQDEIRIFQTNLSRVIQAHPNLYSIIEIVDEYRNILMKKLKKIDDMRYQIAMHEHKLATVDSSNLSDQIWDHQEVRDRLNEFDNDYLALKSNMRHFVSKYIR